MKPRVRAQRARCRHCDHWTDELDQDLVRLRWMPGGAGAGHRRGPSLLMGRQPTRLLEMPTGHARG
eukprot:scaffold22124_cov30-Tisochrysis_lutea.AAC.1